MQSYTCWFPPPFNGPFVGASLKSKLAPRGTVLGPWFVDSDNGQNINNGALDRPETGPPSDLHVAVRLCLVVPTRPPFHAWPLQIM